MFYYSNGDNKAEPDVFGSMIGPKSGSLCTVSHSLFFVSARKEVIFTNGVSLLPLNKDNEDAGNLFIAVSAHVW